MLAPVPRCPRVTDTLLPRGWSACAVAVWGALLGAGTLGCGETRGVILGEPAPETGVVVDASAAAEGGCVGCARSIVLSGDAATPQQGGSTGGTPFGDTCPGEQVVIGYQGYLTDPAVVGLELVGGIETLCGQLVVGGVPGPVGTAPGAALATEGTAQSSPWSQTCPAGHVVVGFSGQSGAALDRVAFVCAPWSADSASPGAVLTMGTPVTLTAAGGDGGAPYATACPAGQLARGSVGRSGQWVDAFGLQCATPTVAAGP